VPAPVAAVTAAGRPRAGERAVRGGKRGCVGVDCGKWSRAVVGPPSGAGWDSGHAQRRSERVRVRVSTANGF
jgi:hypothetical protein